MERRTEATTTHRNKPPRVLHVLMEASLMDWRHYKSLVQRLLYENVSAIPACPVFLEVAASSIARASSPRRPSPRPAADPPDADA